MKDSEVLWIGKIPADWKILKLKYTFYKTNSGEVIDKNYWNDGTELLYTCQKTPMLSTYSTFPDYKRTQENDLLLTRNATPYIFLPELNSIYSNVVQRIKVSGKFDKRYLKYVLSSAVDSTEANGDTIPSWNMEVWSHFKLSFPQTKAQQIKIANYLDSRCNSIDAVIDKTEKTIQQYKYFKQRIIINTITKGLKSNVKCKESNIAWMGKIPEHYEVVRLKYITKISRGLFNHRPRNDERYYDGQYPFIQTGDVAGAKKYITSYSQTLNELGKSVSKQFPKGTMTMTIAANIGDVAILGFDAFFPDSVVGCISLPEYENNYVYYLYCSLKDIFIQSAVVSTQLNLNVDRIKNIKICVTHDKEEQIQISKYLDEKCLEIDNLIEKKEKIIKQLETYKKSLIYEYVTGKKEVK